LHAYIYKLYPEKVGDIKAAQLRQKNKKQAVDLGLEVEKLTKEVVTLNESAVAKDKLVNDYKEQNNILWEHVQEVYNMYDEVLAERNRFAERLKHAS
jgi:hypothetical protein